MAPSLVIFDCDGVLVDSEAIVIEIESAMLTAAGFPVTAGEIAERYVGLSYRDMMTSLAADFDREVPDGLSAEVQEAALAAFPDRLEPVEGVPALLEGLSLPRCVASSSGLERIRLSLELTDLDRHFERNHVFSTQMVERGKPAPDVFLHAAERIGARPADCVVIEDSPPGVSAAVAAGMEVIGFTAGKHATPALAERLLAAGAETIVDNADALAARCQEG